MGHNSSLIRRNIIIRIVNFLSGISTSLYTFTSNVSIYEFRTIYLVLRSTQKNARFYFFLNNILVIFFGIFIFESFKQYPFLQHL